MKISTDIRPWAKCPHCGTVGLHLMRAPNPDPPVLVLPAEYQDEVISRSWDGRVSVHYIPTDTFDREDERGMETVRECTECRKAWGVPSTGKREEK